MLFYLALIALAPVNPVLSQDHNVGHSSNADLASPKCDINHNELQTTTVAGIVHEICSFAPNWDYILVPPISLGGLKGSLMHSGNKTVNFTRAFPYDGRSDYLHVGAAFTDKVCIGRVSFTSGKNNREKLYNCEEPFKTILDHCPTGGELTKGCIVYKITLNESSPWKDYDQNLGDLACKDTEVSVLGKDYHGPLKDTCTCWYANYPGLIDTFRKPKSGKCDGNDVDAEALLTY